MIVIYPPNMSVVRLPSSPLDTKKAPFVLHTLKTRVPSILEVKGFNYPTIGLRSFFSLISLQRTIKYNEGKLTEKQVIHTTKA